MAQTRARRRAVPHRPRSTGGPDRRRHAAAPSARRRRCRSDKGAARSRSSSPHRAWNPGHGTVRLAAGVGLWDTAAGRYLVPGAAADADPPRAAPPASRARPPSSTPPSASPSPGSTRSRPTPCSPIRPGGAIASRATRSPRGDLSPFHALVDFGKLERGVTDNLLGSPQGVPRFGPMNRILASHFETQQGAVLSRACGQPTDCQGELRGRLQPYAIYVPRKPAAERRLRPDPAAALARRELQPVLRQPQPVAARRAGAGVDRDHARGPRARRLVLRRTPARTPSRSGPTSPARYRARSRAGPRSPATRWAATAPTSSRPSTRTCSPARNPVVGPPGLGRLGAALAAAARRRSASNTNRMLASVRNVPFMIWNGAEDELVPVAGPTAQAQTFDDLGYRYVFDLFTSADHFALAVNDQYAPVASFLGTRRSTATRPTSPTWSTRRWTSRTPAPSPTTPTGSRGFACATPAARAARRGWTRGLEGFGLTRPDARTRPRRAAAACSGGNLGPFAYTERRKTWGQDAASREGDVLHLDTPRTSRAPIVHPVRARLSCHPKLEVTTDGPLARDARRLRPHAFTVRLSTAAAPAASLAVSRDGPLPRHLPGHRPGARRGHLRRRLRAPRASSASCSPCSRRSAARSCSGPRSPQPTIRRGPGGRSGAAIALVAFGVVSGVVAGRAGAATRAPRRSGSSSPWSPSSSPRLSLFLEPLALVALAALGWLGSARRRRAQRKYEGLRVLR